MHTYDAAFYQYINEGSTSSARAILPILQQFVPVNSVADFGCGQGAWLAVWKELGVPMVRGIDGQYIDPESLLINRSEFLPHDLTGDIDMGHSYDLVQSLEVAEHLPEQSAEKFINTLTQHGKIILFSAAAPGQGGENHINERPYEYWRKLFRRHGLLAFDPIRPSIKNDSGIMPWYRYNTLVYIHESVIKDLPTELRRCQVPENSDITDVSPPMYRIRKLLLRPLPIRVYTWLAILKKWIFNISAKHRQVS